MPNREQLAAALNYLIRAPRYTTMQRQIAAMVERWPTRPMAFAGELAVLNPLIDVGLKNRVALERFFAIADERRALLPEVRRKDYQRDLMRVRRARLAKAVQIHERRVGHLSRAKRLEYAQKVQKQWDHERASYLADRRGVDRNTAIAEFWAHVDEGLDNQLRPEPTNGATVPPEWRLQ